MLGSEIISVLLTILSIIPVIFINKVNKVPRAAQQIRYEIASYTIILIDVIPANNPPNEKNGKFLYKNTLTGSFKKYDTTITNIVPTKLINEDIPPVFHPVLP